MDWTMSLSDEHPRISRRAFQRTVAACVLGGEGARSAVSAEPAKASPSGRYIDIHTHLGQTWNTSRPLAAEELLRWMDAQDISQAVVLPLVSPEAASYPLTTDFVLTQTRPFRDRLIPFCCIDPRTSYTGSQRGLVDMLARYVDRLLVLRS